jgi:GNAT superfamily N-acetyltransferase
MRADDWHAFNRIDKELFPDDVMRERWFLLTLTLEREKFLALDVGGRLAGMLILARSGEHVGHLRRIGVAKAHQRMGYGRLLTRYAIDWFRKEGFKRAYLYTQDFNIPAQNLYAQFGFQVSGTSWQYIVPFQSVTPSGGFICQEIDESEIPEVEAEYPREFPTERIQRDLSSDRFQVMTLRNHSGELRGACRFFPELPGCTFAIDETDCFDDFIIGIRHLCPDFDSVQVTFSDCPPLADLCSERGYTLHHRLLRMTLELT